jgi:glycosyltransferase involved in cell wall biosynthesis
MTGACLVSILTPSFNQGRWLRETLVSVANQTYPHIEHVVVDGGSTDDSVALLERAGESVRWVSEPDHGQSEAINKAFASSRGEIIGWLNSDDAYFSRTAVERAVCALAVHPEAPFAYGHSVLVDGEGRLLHFNWAPPFWRWMFQVHNFVVQPAAFVRRSAIEGPLVDERFDYAMDRELWLRLARRGRPVRVPEVLAIDRHHAARKSYTRPEVYAHDHELLVDTYGVPDLRRSRLRLKAAKVSLRFAGSRLALSSGTRAEPACRIDEPTRFGLLARQVLLPRRVMSP